MKPLFDQHFLHDGKVVKTILDAADVPKGSTVLEIGPGRGSLTYSLADRAKRLVAVELDLTLVENFQRRLATRSHVQIIHADFLKVDLDSLFPLAERPIQIVGNLPYSITTPIFEKLMAWPGWNEGIFLIQREVAERMRSEPGSKTFGILSLAVQLLAQVEIISQVKPESFSPPPRVHSSVVRLVRKPEAAVAPELVSAFFDLAHGAFAHRRKTLANSLALYTGRPKSELLQWLQDRGISVGVRAESLGLGDYANLAGPWAIYRREISLT